MPEFKLKDGGIMLIRTLDTMSAAEDMARKLGIQGEIRVCVGQWDENGSIVGWTKKNSVGGEDLLVEVFISRLSEEDREFNRYAKMFLKLQEENAALKAQLAEHSA